MLAVICWVRDGGSRKGFQTRGQRKRELICLDTPGAITKNELRRIASICKLNAKFLLSTVRPWGELKVVQGPRFPLGCSLFLSASLKGLGARTTSLSKGKLVEDNKPSLQRFIPLRTTASFPHNFALNKQEDLFLLTSFRPFVFFYILWETMVGLVCRWRKSDPPLTFERRKPGHPRSVDMYSRGQSGALAPVP